MRDKNKHSIGRSDRSETGTTGKSSEESISERNPGNEVNSRQENVADENFERSSGQSGNRMREDNSQDRMRAERQQETGGMDHERRPIQNRERNSEGERTSDARRRNEGPVNEERKAKKGSGRGFASMDPEEVRNIASMGGRAAHASGKAHEFTSAEARKAARERWR